MTGDHRVAAPERGAIDPLGGVLVALATMQFGGVVVLGKLVGRTGFPVPSFLAIRFGLAGVLLATSLAAVRQPLVAATRERGWLAVLGAAYALEASLFFLALGHGTAATVTLLFFTYPVIVSAIAVATGRGIPGRLVVLALLLALTGSAVVVVAGQGLDISTAGILLALGASVMFSVYLTGADAVVKGTHSMTGAMWVSVSAAVALALFAFVGGLARWPAGWRQWGPILGVALFTAGAFFCLFAGLRRLGAVRTSIVAASEPLAAAVLGVIFLDEPVRGGIVLGGVLILAGAVIASLARREPSVEPPLP